MIDLPRRAFRRGFYLPTRLGRKVVKNELVIAKINSIRADEGQRLFRDVGDVQTTKPPQSLFIRPRLRLKHNPDFVTARQPVHHRFVAVPRINRGAGKQELWNRILRHPHDQLNRGDVVDKLRLADHNCDRRLIDEDRHQVAATFDSELAEKLLHVHVYGMD